MGMSLAAAQRQFEVEFAEWLELSKAYLDPSGFPNDLAHERAMDVLYEKRVKIEAWLGAYQPHSSMEALCLLEVIQFHDELEDFSARALGNVQQWLARGLVGTVATCPAVFQPLIQQRVTLEDHSQQ